MAAARIAGIVHLVVAWLLVAGVVTMFFLAGLGVFAGSANFTTHRDVGYLLQLFPVVLFVAAIIGRLGRRQVVATIVILVLLILQSILVTQRDSIPEIAALHPVNGFVIALLAIQLAREAWTRWREEEPAEEPVGAA